MLPRHSLCRHAARALTTVTLTAALAAAGAGAATATPRGPDYQAPQVGDCHQITLAQGGQASETSAPTDCATSHTVRVIAVGHLPDGVTWSQTAAVAKAATRACVPALDETLGRSAKVRDSSAYTSLWFIPTKDQRSHGARWIRCDIALYGGSKLVALPTDATPALDAPPLPDKVARCLTGKALTTTCARTHAWRATGTFTVASKKFPGTKRLNRLATDKCVSRISGNTYRWTYKSPLVWNLGDHVVVCYSKTSS